MMLFPLLRKILKIYYLNKIVIPDFIIDYIEDKYWLVGIVVTILALLPFLHFSALDVCLTPDFIWEKNSQRSGQIQSREDKKALLVLYLELALVCRQTYLFFILLLIPILASQVLMDGFDPYKESLVLGIINFVLIKNFPLYGLDLLSLIKFVSFLTGEELEITPRRKKDHWMRWGVMGCACIFRSWGLCLFRSSSSNKPLIISHREYLIRMVCKIQSNL